MLKVTYTDKQWTSGRSTTWLTTQDQLDWLLLKQRMGMHPNLVILKVKRAEIVVRQAA